MSLQQNVSNKYNFIFLVTIFILILKPAPGMLFGNTSTTLITLLSLFISAVLYVIANFYLLKSISLKSLINDAISDRILVFQIVTIIFFFISTIYGNISNPSRAHLSDFLELYRYAFYLIFYLLAKGVFSTKFRRIEVSLLILFFIVELFGIMQFVNLFNINNHLGLLYTMSERHFQMIMNQHRIPSTLLNPNMYGSFLILIAAIFLSYLIFAKNKLTIVILYFFITLTIISVLFTTSRTAVISLGGIIIYWVLLNLLFNTKAYKKILINGIAILVLYLLIAFVAVPKIHYLNYAANQIFKTYTSQNQPLDAENNNNGQNDDSSNPNNDSIKNARKSLESVSSFKSRYDYWKLNYNQFKKAPIIGLGPMKNGFISFADNSYLYLLPRYGIIGFFIFALFIIYLFWKSLGRFRNSASTKTRQFGVAINLIIVAYFVMGFVSEVWFNLQSMVLFYVLIGLLYNRKIEGITN